MNRGQINGTSDTIFSPDGAMPRGILVTALGRLAGAGKFAPDSYVTREQMAVIMERYAPHF